MSSPLAVNAATTNPTATTGTAGAGTANGDALDKGISGLLSKSGHGQSGSTTEKISDGVRTGFKKLTGKDVPVKDQQMQ